MAKPKKLSKAEEEQVKLFEEFGRMAIAAGCPDEQIINLTIAGVILQPKQLQFCAMARECDKPDGPKQILFGGGRGSAKSHGVLAQIFCDDCQRVKGLKCLALRKVGRANKEQINDFRKKLLPNLQHTYREQAQEIIFQNGSMVILGNFKDEKDIDKYLGLEYDLIYIMESNQLTQSKKVNILSCLRTNKSNWRPRCYQDTNPGGIDHVANKRIFVDAWKAGTEKDTRYIHATVDDNKFVDADYKKFLETLVGWQREAWLNGSWEFMAGAFFSNFHEDVHVYPNPVTQFNIRSVVRWFAGFDYGYSHPNAFVLVAEDENGNLFVTATYSASGTLIEEHAANIRDLLSRFNLDVSDLEFIAAGKDCFRVDKDGSTVATEYQERGITLTPVHIDRINAWSQVAEVFGDVYHQIKPRCFINRECEELILQIQSAQCDPKKPNDILKMNADPETGDGGDDQLEACFVAGTMVKTKEGLKPIEEINENDLVLTREGFKRVLSSGVTGNSKETIRVDFSNGCHLIGTSNHPIHTERGWVRLDSLRNDDIVSSCVKQSFSTEENSGVIRIQKEQPTGTISSQAELEKSTVASFYIRRFGNFTMERFQMDFKFITRMATRLTTTFQTLNAFLQKFTHQGMTILQKKQRSTYCTLNPSGHLLRLGTSQRNVQNLQKEIGKRLWGSVLLNENLNVCFAGLNSSLTPLIKGLSFVRPNAKRLRNEKTEGILRKENVKFVAQASNLTSAVQPQLVHANAVALSAAGLNKVYNLEVEDCHEYFANGILVHNCRNAVVMAYSSLLSSAKAVQMGSFKSLSEPMPDYVDVESEIIQSEKEDLERRGIFT